uniref:FAD-dependent oxidoreductase n=1 Tax=candidate division WOR-3 bacterium TaxID=2052148 RepID=A0A7V3RGL8_UNCW3
MRKGKVCIIGASAAGLFTAWRLANAGKQVLMYE